MGACLSSPPNTEPSNERSSEDKKGSDKDVNSEEDLHTAARDGDVARVRTLIEAGADVNWWDEDGSPLYWASSNGHEAVAQLLRDAGAERRTR